jgi:hypothetical protein
MSQASLKNWSDGNPMKDRKYRHIHLLLWLLGSTLLFGCSSPNPYVRVQRGPGGYLQVDGPLRGPFKTLEELAENSCALLTSQPGAMNGPYGFEYCSLYYYSPEEKGFMYSFLSDLSTTLPDGTKTCTVPRRLNDPSHTDAIILGSAHNHPHNPKVSNRDVSTDARLRPDRIADSTGKVWTRSTMIFYRQKSGPCRTYLFNYSTLTISVLIDGKWDDIATVINDQGHIRLLDGKDWLH